MHIYRTTFHTIMQTFLKIYSVFAYWYATISQLLFCH